MEITDTELKDKLALALDVDDLVAAMRLCRSLKDHFGVAKIGLELYSAAGPEAIGAVADLGYKVFLDLKLHDIPTTVGKSARVLGALGVQYLTFHAHGGVDMLRSGVDGLDEGARNAGLDRPSSLAITFALPVGTMPITTRPCASPRPSMTSRSEPSPPTTATRSTRDAMERATSVAPESLRVAGDIQGTDTDDGEAPPSWIFNLSLDEERLDELTGDLDRIDGNGDVNLECDLELDLLSDPTN